MKEFIDKLISRLEEEKKQAQCEGSLSFAMGFKVAISIVNELAEEFATDINVVSNNGWIPCERELPKNGVDVLVWFEYFRYGNYNRLYQTTGISYTYNGEWSGFVNGSSGWSQLNIIAWQPLPQPYHKQEELQHQPEWKDKVMKHFTKTE